MGDNVNRPERHAIGTVDFAKVPYRIGLLNDLPGIPGFSNVFVDGVRLALEWCEDEGIVDRPVELVIREALAQPWRDARSVLNAWHELVDGEGVLGVAGPMTTDNCLALLEDVEAGRVPTMTICGSQQYVGRFAFNLSNGGMGDEPALIAAWLASANYRKVAVMFDSPSQIGSEYLQYFQLNAADRKVSITAQIGVPPLPSADEMNAAVQQAKDSGADAVVHLTLGGPEMAALLAPAFARLDWAPPRITTTAFVGTSYNDRIRDYWEGWSGVEQIHESNVVFSTVLDLWEKRFGYRPFNSAASVSWDIGHAFGIALGRMRVTTPAGLTAALETIRRLPAATGGPGTIITFGPQDHRGFKGPDFLLLRRISGGRNELVGTVPVEW
jgi:branched-chain amino acid transport system substrate-binding protein